MKKILLSFFTFLSISIQGSELPPYLKTVFEQMKVRTALEFGISGHTSELLKEAGKVITIEFITHGYGPDALKAEMEKCKGISNWIPIAYFTGYQGDVNWAAYRYFGTESVYKATCHQAETHQSFSSIDDFYITEISSFLANLKKCYKLDLVEVGGAVILRGDIINALFGKVPVIVGTSSSDSTNLFGYNIVKTPEDYEEIVFRSHNITVWVSKAEEHTALREALLSTAH